MEAGRKKILYIEDDQDDQEILCGVIREMDPAIEIVFADDGIKGLEYLYAAKNNSSDLPCLIVLDINMPILDGKETFQKIRSDAALQNVPIVIFSSSEKPLDKAYFNSFGVEFITKPNTLTYMSKAVSKMLSACS